MTRRAPGFSVILSKILAGLLFQASFLFLGAGTIGWREAWIYLSACAGASFTITILLRRHDPGLLAQRLELSARSTDFRDKLIFAAGLPLYISLLVVPGFDAVRWRVSAVPDPIKAIAFGLFLVSFVISWRVMRENPFLTRTLSVQRDRGHRVVTTGPYRIVRHPFYSAAVLSFIAIPIALGSWLGLVPAATLAFLIMIRIRIEEEMLRDGLPGYTEYAQTVRYRLLPGLW
jgi:protein-S-isoprenylcysteine O-methyltransferase Ste14